MRLNSSVDDESLDEIKSKLAVYWFVDWLVLLHHVNMVHTRPVVVSSPACLGP